MLSLLNDLNTDSILLVFMTVTCFYMFVHHVFLLLVYS